MHPFHVICETCHARLKVSSASVVGEIHACPKCGSMVEVRLPAAGMDPLSSNAGTSIEIGVSTLATSFDDVAAPQADFAAPPLPVLPASVGQSAAVWWVLGGASILIAGGLAIVMLTGSRVSSPRNSTPAARMPVHNAVISTPKTVEPDPAGVTSQEADKNLRPEPVTEPSREITAAEVDPDAALLTLPALPPAETEPTSDSNGVAEVVADPPPPPENAAAATQAAEGPTEEARSKPVMSLDPLDFDPSQFSFNADENVSEAADSSSIPKNGDAEARAVSSNAPSNDTEKALVIKQRADRSLYVRLGPVADGSFPPQRNAEQLGTRIEALAVEDTQLFRFVDMVSELSDVAVTLDPFELELAGVAPRRMVGIDAKDATVEQVLRDVFTKQRLDLVERDGQLGIALAGGDTRREITYDVADLAGTEGATPLAKLVQRFVAPDSWTDAGGGGSIKVEKSRLLIEQSQRVRHEVLIFCERLRLARGLSQRSRYPAALLATGSPYEAAAPTLRQRATFTLLPWTRLSDAVRHWQDASKLTILVDWRALAEIELGPSTPVACSAIDRTWEEALDGILEPIGLAWWAVNGETIQITSRETLDGIRRVEFYSVPKAFGDQFATDNDLVKSLQDELAELIAKDRAKPLAPVMELDEPSGRLIVLATQVSHRRLTQLLVRGAKQVVSQDP